MPLLHIVFGPFFGPIPTVRWPYPIVRSIPFYVYVESSQRLVFTCSCGVLQGFLM